MDCYYFGRSGIAIISISHPNYRGTTAKLRHSLHLLVVYITLFVSGWRRSSVCLLLRWKRNERRRRAGLLHIMCMHHKRARDPGVTFAASWERESVGIAAQWVEPKLIRVLAALEWNRLWWTSNYKLSLAWDAINQFVLAPGNQSNFNFYRWLPSWCSYSVLWLQDKLLMPFHNFIELKPFTKINYK